MSYMIHELNTTLGLPVTGSLIDGGQTREQVKRLLERHGLAPITQPLPRFGRVLVIAMPVGQRSYCIVHR